jgi:hypothetical protein
MVEVEAEVRENVAGFLAGDDQITDRSTRSRTESELEVG